MITEYPLGSASDRRLLSEMLSEKLMDYFFLQVRNLWRIDGLYFLEIEKKYGTEAATEIDTRVWETMGKIEAKTLQKLFEIGDNPDIATMMNLLRKTSWALDQPFKAIDVSERRAVLSIDKCRTQETRISKGLCEFACKTVRFSYLKAFAGALNPRATVNCLICPPDKHPEDTWCKWEFIL